jgi:hypothetical protein
MLELAKQMLKSDLALGKLATLHLENILNNPSISFARFP